MEESKMEERPERDVIIMFRVKKSPLNEAYMHNIVVTNHLTPTPYDYHMTLAIVNTRAKPKHIAKALNEGRMLVSDARTVTSLLPCSVTVKHLVQLPGSQYVVALVPLYKALQKALNALRAQIQSNWGPVADMGFTYLPHISIGLNSTETMMDPIIVTDHVMFEFAASEYRCECCNASGDQLYHYYAEYADD